MAGRCGKSAWSMPPWKSSLSRSPPVRRWPGNQKQSENIDMNWMTRSIVIGRRELSSYFFSPLAYVAMTLFLLAAGFLFYGDFSPGQVAGMRSLFGWMVWLLVFIIPTLSMGLLAQEWS